MIGKRLNRPRHCFDLCHFYLEPLDMCERESLDVGAGAASVGPEAQQLADLLHGKAKITRAPDEAQAVHVGVVIVAVARVLTRNLGDETHLLVITDHLWRDARYFRGAADVHASSPSFHIGRASCRERVCQYG